MIKYFLIGFVTKILMGFDDAITHVPILAGTTKGQRGRLLFAMGTLIALTFIIMLAMYFSQFLRNIPYYRYVLAAILLVFAAILCVDSFVHEPRNKTAGMIEKARVTRGLQSLGIGFVAGMATLLDDVIAFSPLLIDSLGKTSFVISGIYAGALLEIFAVIYFSKQLQKFKYKDQVAASGLVLIAMLLVFGII